jgi:hypothetical protein
MLKSEAAASVRQALRWNLTLASGDQYGHQEAHPSVNFVAQPGTHAPGQKGTFQWAIGSGHSDSHSLRVWGALICQRRRTGPAYDIKATLVVCDFDGRANTRGGWGSEPCWKLSQFHLAQWLVIEQAEACANHSA